MNGVMQITIFIKDMSFKEVHNVRQIKKKDKGGGSKVYGRH